MSQPDATPDSVIITEDGSQTIISPIYGEKYHSIYGAITESKHVFIDAGLRNVDGKQIVSILEMGFGTGLNAYMTLIASRDSGQKIHYITYEKHPVPKDVWLALNYHVNEADKEIFHSLHELEWNKKHTISPNFSFEKRNVDIVEMNISAVFDIVYYDAFAPNAQEELWTTEIFLKMFNCLQDGGILVTYCAKGYVKRNLKAAGFVIEALPGPPGKREMTRARKVI